MTTLARPPDRGESHQSGNLSPSCDWPGVHRGQQPHGQRVRNQGPQRESQPGRGLQAESCSTSVEGLYRLCFKAGRRHRCHCLGRLELDVRGFGCWHPGIAAEPRQACIFGLPLIVCDGKLVMDWPRLRQRHVVVVDVTMDVVVVVGVVIVTLDLSSPPSSRSSSPSLTSPSQPSPSSSV